MEVSDHQLCNVIDFKTNITILNLDDKEVLNFTDNIESTKKYFSSTLLSKLSCSIIISSATLRC